MHTLHERSSHSAPYKPHRVGTRNNFFGSKSKKTKKRFMIFDPKKKRGVHFFDIFDPRPNSLKKVGFKGGGGLGEGPYQKIIRGCFYWTK